jgi:hypothetical protein
MTLDHVAHVTGANRGIGLEVAVSPQGYLNQFGSFSIDR